MLRLACAIALLLAATGAATAACSRENTAPRQYMDCLGEAQKAAGLRLDEAFAGALAAVRGDDAIQPPQRQRWANQLEEAQARFVLWRNFECQNVAPYEGGAARKTVGGRLGGMGALEQRLVCLAARNTERADDLSRRYPPPPGWRYAAPAPPASKPPASKPEPESRAPAGPVRIIEMPR